MSTEEYKLDRPPYIDLPADWLDRLLERRDTDEMQATANDRARLDATGGIEGNLFPTLEDEFAAWDAASDEALAAFDQATADDWAANDPPAWAEVEGR